MKRRCSAFTLAEMLVAMSVAGLLGGIVYTVASEGLFSFANNASINRTFSDAREAIFRINSALKAAGHNPQLLDATGAPAAGPAAGVRFYRLGNLPSYVIPSGQSTASTLTLTFSAGQADSSTPPIIPGDLATIPLLGFQDTVTSTAGYSRNADGSGGITLNFAKPIYQSCTPALPVDSSRNTVPISFVPSGSNPTIYYSCLAFRQVAFIAVPNGASGADLRYYPQAMSAGSGSACGNLTAFNGAAAFGNAQNFRVVATIPGKVTDATLTPLKPFSVNVALSPGVLNVALCTTSPEYSNRNLRPANSFSVMRSSMASRSPVLLHGMLIPF